VFDVAPWRTVDTLAIMTKQSLEILLEHVATWPEEAQEELVQSMVDIEKKHLGIYHLNDEERAAVRRGLREMREGKLASEDEVARAFARYRA
jgi:predicted transcriptional regulator